PLAGGEPKRLTTDPGNHAFNFGRKSEVYVHSFSLADGRAGSKIVRAGGASLGELKSVAEEPPIPKAELLTVGEKTFHASIIRPGSLDSSKKYPVIVHVYGGPHSLTVNSSPRGSVLQQWLADQGFIVVSLDGRGTPRHGRDWERAIKGNLIDVPLEDQV